MNWYFVNKTASGKFVLPRIAYSLISYFEWRVKSSFGVPSLFQEQITVGELIENYKPKKDSIYNRYYHGMDVELVVALQTSYREYSYAAINGSASFGDDPKFLNIRLDVLVTPETKSFDDIPEDLNTKIEHEVYHLVEIILGYEHRGEYKADLDSEEGYLEYVGQPGERRQKYTNISNSLQSGARNRDRSFYQGLKVLYEMRQSIMRYYPQDFPEFAKRIVGLVNVLDREFGQDPYWLMIRQKTIDVLKGNLDIT